MSKKAAWIATGLLVALAQAFHQAFYVTESIDDAYITFRYARNLHQGLGLVWNAGERLEGMTNLLWAVVLAPLVDRVDLMVVAKLTGLLCSWATTALVLDWARRKEIAVGGALVGLLAVAALPWEAHWAQQGLETPLVALLTTVAWTQHGRDSRYPWWALGAALAPLVRPDAAVVPAVLLWVELGRALRQRRWPHRRELWGFAFVGAVGALTAWFKWSYYGDLFPNTFYVKVDPYPHTLGLNYVRNFLEAQSPLFGALVVGVLALSLLTRNGGASPAWIVLVYGLFVSWWTGGDFFRNYRFLVPSLPALAAVFAAEVGRGTWGKGHLALLPRVAAAAAILWACLPQAKLLYVAGADGTVQDARADLRVTPKVWNPAELRATLPPPLVLDGVPTMIPAAVILTHVPTGATVAYTDIGVPGYLNDHPLVDLYGLTDRVVAGREPGRDPAAYVLERADTILIRTTKIAGLRKRLDDAMPHHPEYSLVLEAKNLRVYARKGGWAPLPEAEIAARVDRLLSRFPRTPALQRATIELLGLAGGHEPSIRRIVEHQDRVGTEASKAHVREGACAAGLVDYCSAGKAHWSIGDEAPRSHVDLPGAPVAPRAAPAERPAPAGWDQGVLTEVGRWPLDGALATWGLELWPKAGDPQFAVTSATLDGGAAGARLQATGDTSTSGGRLCTPEQPVKGPWLVTARVRVAELTPIAASVDRGLRLEFRGKSATGGPTPDIPAGKLWQADEVGGWTDVRVPYVPPADAVTGRLCLRFVRTTGTAEVDALAVSEAAAEPTPAPAP